MKQKRLKKHHQLSAKRADSSFKHEKYPYLHSYYYRCIRTRQEKSISYMHLMECHEMDIRLKIRVSRLDGLAESWDDIPSFFNKTAKSWKHNSKRAHQYYKEKRA